MKPVLLIHGYSSEGKSNSSEDIYGSLPTDLRKTLGQSKVIELNLSRWISLSDGVRIDDVSYAMDRALRSGFSKLLKDGFHVIVHSTGALVVRNWLKNHSPKPSPIENIVHLAGANFGSGLAHVGKGQLSRWSRQILHHTGRGKHVLRELEFGAWKTLDLHAYFLQPGNSLYHDFNVQEYCVSGSHIEDPLRLVPIRYIKEDSSDNTVRTSACNLNFQYCEVKSVDQTLQLSVSKLKDLVALRLDNETIDDNNYAIETLAPTTATPAIPFAIPYKTSHFGNEVGIVNGENNRGEILDLITLALRTPNDPDAYGKTEKAYAAHTQRTLTRVGNLKPKKMGWNRQHSYEGHSQLILRIRDQYGEGLNTYDVTFRSVNVGQKTALETLIEDRHANSDNDGTVTFYFRTQQFIEKTKQWRNRLDTIAPMHIEITGSEINAQEINFVPLNLRLSAKEMQQLFKPFQTTVMDIEMVRLPKSDVFSIKKG
ncbi:MAG: esterase/lipase family protein [Halioglobus sp.]